MKHDLSKRIYVAGHRGLVGSALVRALDASGRTEIVTRSHSELDLTDQAHVRTFFAEHRFDEVYLAAARVGGIQANNVYPADFIRDNLLIQTNVIDAAWRNGVARLLFLGSSCVYPRLAAQPMREEYLMTGALEPTNEPYAVAKIAGIKMCESYHRQHGADFRSVMPTNLYGPGDNYHPENSHVIPALIRRFHEAKLQRAAHVAIWGSGTPRREFLHVDDMARACIHIMNLDRTAYDATTSPQLSHINVGTGEDVTIREVAEVIRTAIGYEGEIEFDGSKPDGAPRKLLDTTKLNALGWRPRIRLDEGIKATYACFLAEHS